MILIFSNKFLAESLLRFLEYPWKRLDYSLVESAEGIVVLSSGRNLPPGDSKIIEWNDPDRFFAGINLLKANKADRLIFTGGINPLRKGLPPEGDIYLEEAISLGIPKQKVFTTYPVTNTFQEAKAVKQLLIKELDFKKKEIILVTSAFHMKRAKRVFEREGIIVQPYPVDFRASNKSYSSLRNPLNWIPNAGNLHSSSASIREIFGRIIYKIW